MHPRGEEILNLSTIPFTRFDPGNPLARAYAVEPGRILHRFGADYRDPRALRPLLDAPRRRPDLGALVEYNRAVGGSAENAARLADGFCVVSGQQVGLLLGPAYTTYKLFTVINAAAALARELDADVVPVFWVESEDHDWDEVNRFFWKARRFRIEAEVEPGTPLSAIEADATRFLDEVRAEIGDRDDAWELVRPDPHVARWHVRNLARLVDGCGVVFLEPGLLRDPLRSFAAEIAAAPEKLDASLHADTGFERRLAPPDGAYLFDAAAGRTRLPRGAPLPDAWSTDVSSRVLVQNAALPALAAVCGPAEIQYWAQLKEAHAAFDVPFPAVLPRDGATLVEEGIARDAARLGLDLEEVVRGVVTKPREPEAAADPVAERLRRLAGEAGELQRALEDGRLDLPGNTAKPFRRTVERLEAELGKLAGRLDDARAEEAGVGRRKFERVLRELRPRGGPQERSHSLFPYLVRHGPDLARRLREAFDPFEIGHYLVQLG